MPNTIQLKRSSTAASAPTAGVLSLGELAINTVDEKIFFKNSAGTVKSLSASTDLTSNLVTIATNQTVTGDKTFSSAVNIGQLQVDGTSYFIDTTEFDGIINAYGSIYLGGFGKLSYTNTNFFFGDANTGAALTFGTNNTVLGWQANRDITTGSNNTAMGYRAMRSLTTGGSNTALGSQALLNCTTSSYNTAIGSSSLINCTTGSGSNTAIGNSAAYRLTTGSTNTAIGYQALFGSASVTSQANTAIGYNSMVSNTSGSYNSGIGINSLYSLTTGQQNTAVGTESLFAITTTSNNTGIGQLALRYATQGQNNTAVGIFAGAYKTASNTNLTAVGNNCTFIGAESRASGDNASDEVVIGYQAVGIGSNTVTVGKSTNVANRFYGVVSTGEAAPTIASAATIAPTKPITFISGTTQINTITAPTGISTSGGQITLIPTGLFTTGTSGNIALATTAVVSKALIMTYDSTTTKWYPSY